MTDYLITASKLDEKLADDVDFRKRLALIQSAIREAVEEFRGLAMQKCEEMDRLYRSQNNHQHAAACAVMRAEIRQLARSGPQREV